MKFVILLLTLVACNPIKQLEPKVGECVLGPQMNVMKLIRMEDNKYLFASVPVTEGSPVDVYEDPRALKKVECP